MSLCNPDHDLSIRPNIELYSQFRLRCHLQSLGQNPAIPRFHGRLVGAKDVITIIHVGKGSDLIIDHVHEWTNIGEIKNHDPHELIGEISGNEKGVMCRRSGLVIFTRIKSMAKFYEKVA